MDQLTEETIHQFQLPEQIGDRWRDLARAFGYNEAVIDAIEKDKCGFTKECCIAIIVRWMGREGQDATAGKLAEALIRIELRNVAERLTGTLPGKPCIDSDQDDKFEKRISEMNINCRQLQENCKQLQTNCKQLEEEGSEMRARNKQLEEQLLDKEQECSVLRAKVMELEKELADERQQHQAISQEYEDGFVVLMTNDATRDDLDTDQTARERRISEQLNNLDKELKTYVTSVLQVPEVKEDKLRTAVKLDLLLKLSWRLQEMYTKIVSMAADTCRCGENLKREFYDFAYHGLRAEHNDLVPRVKDLESLLTEMSDEEKKDFERLQQHQTNRQRQVDRLENLWRGLFSSPENLPKTCSDPSGGSASSSGKTLSRNNTETGTKEQSKPPSAGEGVDVLDKCKGYLKKFKPEGMFGRRESKDNMSFPVSYTHRDS